MTQIVNKVLADSTNRHVTAEVPAATKKKSQKDKKEKAKAPTKRVRAGMKCPLCGKGKVIKGKTAYGCSRWNDPHEPCQFRKPF